MSLTMSSSDKAGLAPEPGFRPSEEHDPAEHDQSWLQLRLPVRSSHVAAE